MNEQALVSIIVPVHNAEDVLDECLLSLVGQSYENLEILLIDDASADASYKRMQSWAVRDKRIRISRHFPNKGVAYTRNLGIRNANGDYLMFCDSDDWYEATAIETLVRAALEQNAEIVVANYQYVSANGRKTTVSLFEHYQEGSYPDRMAEKRALLADSNLGACGKLYAKELIVREGLHFQEGLRVNEEVCFTLPALIHADKVTLLREIVYNYRQSRDSVSNRAHAMNFDDFTTAFDALLARADPEQFGTELEYVYIKNILYGKTLNLIKAGRPREQIFAELTEAQSRFPHWRQNPYLPEFGRSKNAFLNALAHRRYLQLRLMAWIHSLLRS